MKKVFTLLSLMFLLSSCVTKPADIKPVKNFDTNKYLGKWYEIARFDNWFEKGLTDVTAEYSLNPNGTIKVINSGINPKTGKRDYAKGIAKFVGDKDIGYLKVSFFRPFYGAYVVFGLDNDYQNAYIVGNDKSYLWLLSRTPTVSNNIKNKFLAKIKSLGFDTNKLVWVKQETK